MSPAEDTKLSVLREMYKADFETLEADLAKAFGANSAVAAALDARSKEASAAGNNFLKNEVEALINGELSREPQAYFDKATKAIDNLYGLFDITIEQLDGLLVARIHRLQSNLNLTLYGTGGVLFRCPILVRRHAGVGAALAQIHPSRGGAARARRRFATRRQPFER